MPDLGSLFKGKRRPKATLLAGLARPVASPFSPDADTATPAEDVSEQDRGFRARMEREQDRFVRTTDSEYWLAVCFRTAADKEAFLSATGLAELGSRYLDGRQAAQILGVDEANGSGAAGLFGTKKPAVGGGLLSQLDGQGVDPLAEVTYTGNLEADALAELTALRQALSQPPKPSRDVLDSPHWFVLYFPLRSDKEAFLTAAGLGRLGDKYLDGHQAAQILDVRFTR